MAARKMYPERCINVSDSSGSTSIEAMHDYRRGYREAAKWIDSDRVDHPLAFTTICESLDLSPADVRKAARKGSGRRR
jgi:hypothetical protein